MVQSGEGIVSKSERGTVHVHWLLSILPTGLLIAGLLWQGGAQQAAIEANTMFRDRAESRIQTLENSDAARRVQMENVCALLTEIKTDLKALRGER